MNSGMSATNLEETPRWAVYLKALLFLGPALLVWVMTEIFIAPKLKMLWATAGGQRNLVFLGMDLTQEFGLWIAIALAGLFLLLERFSVGWRRYRKICISMLVFTLNLAVLLSLTALLVTAVDLFGAAAALR
jgi:hypothetical protein